MFDFLNERNKTRDLEACHFEVGDDVIAFNSQEWSKTGDLPQGNDKYYQEAKITKLRTSNLGEGIADIIFKNGKKSNGHFLSGLEHCL